MASVRVVLAVGLAVLAIAVGVLLTGSPVTVIGTNSIPAHVNVGFATGGSSACQLSGTIPRGTSAIRISLSANVGPRVSLEVLSGSAVLARGARAAGWGVQETVTVPIKPVPRAIPNTHICLKLGPAIEYIQINGARARTIDVNGRVRQVTRLRFEYLRAGNGSWWSRASSIARHMGLGHAASGTWIVFLVVGLMLTVAALASRLVIRELK